MGARSRKQLRSERRKVWLAALRLGASVLPSSPVLGLKRFVLPVSYWRCAEFAYALSHLPCHEPARLLDVGSPKELAVLLARRCGGLRVVATDILPEAIEAALPYASALPPTEDGSDRVVFEVQDGRELAYEDDAFDAAFSVSVLEHIPDAGDTAAVRELVRVVKPGGRIVITVPYDPGGYRETWLAEDVYERRREGEEQVFYQRHYDDVSLRERLLEPARAEVLKVELWGEGGVRVEAMLRRLERLSFLTSPLEPLLSLLFLRRLAREEEGRPMAAFVTLRKPERPT